MSAPAIKSSMPGVGSNTTGASHPMLPMNMVAQKVVQNSESSTMKPMSGSSLSYVTLQPASQPLSLVQDHNRPPIYQTTPQPPTYATANAEKEVVEDNLEKPTIPNGLEIATKIELEQAASTTLKSSECSKNNSSSTESNVQEQQPQEQQTQLQSESQPQQPEHSEEETVPTQLGNLNLNTHLPSKVEDKKSPVNNNSSKESKETETSNSAPTVQNTPNIQAQKSEESVAIRNENPQKVKTQIQSPSVAKPVPVENSVMQTSSNLPKAEVKVSSTQVARANKRKPKDSVEARGQGSFETVFKPKRRRRRTEPFQSPLPEIAMIVKTLSKPTVTKANNDDKLIVFYKNEFLAVRNTEGSFYVCQAMQNIYKSSRRIRIRWLSQDKTNGEIYSPDFYDFTDFDCILTNLNLNKIDKNKFQLTKMELLRTENILKRAIDVERGVSEKPSVTEEHPDGLDLSLYKDESQLKKRKSGSSKQKRQRKKTKRSSSASISEDEESDEEESDKKKTPSKSHQTKKRQSTNKALAIAKSVAKSSSRAERALNRGNKSTGSVNNLPAGNVKVDGSKKNTEAKKVEAKKPSTSNKPQNNSPSTTSRTASRGNMQSTTSTSKTLNSRPKRGSGNGTSTTINAEEGAPRKKPRGRA